MEKLEAIVAVRYAGRQRMPGDQFDALTQKDAFLLKATGKVRSAKEHLEPAAPLMARDMQAEDPPRQKRAYRRRDMRA